MAVSKIENPYFILKNDLLNFMKKIDEILSAGQKQLKNTAQKADQKVKAELANQFNQENNLKDKIEKLTEEVSNMTILIQNKEVLVENYKFIIKNNLKKLEINKKNWKTIPLKIKEIKEKNKLLKKKMIKFDENLIELIKLSHDQLRELKEQTEEETVKKFFEQANLEFKIYQGNNRKSRINNWKQQIKKLNSEQQKKLNDELSNLIIRNGNTFTQERDNITNYFHKETEDVNRLAINKINAELIENDNKIKLLTDELNNLDKNNENITEEINQNNINLINLENELKKDQILISIKEKELEKSKKELVKLENNFFRDENYKERESKTAFEFSDEMNELKTSTTIIHSKIDEILTSILNLIEKSDVKDASIKENQHQQYKNCLNIFKEKIQILKNENKINSESSIEEFDNWYKKITNFLNKKSKFFVTTQIISEKITKEFQKSFIKIIYENLIKNLIIQRKIHDQKTDLKKRGMKRFFKTSKKTQTLKNSINELKEQGKEAAKALDKTEQDVLVYFTNILKITRDIQINQLKGSKLEKQEKEIDNLKTKLVKLLETANIPISDEIFTIFNSDKNDLEKTTISSHDEVDSNLFLKKDSNKKNNFLIRWKNHIKSYFTTKPTVISFPQLKIVENNQNALANNEIKPELNSTEIEEQSSVSWSQTLTNCYDKNNCAGELKSDSVKNLWGEIPQTNEPAFF